MYITGIMKITNINNIYEEVLSKRCKFVIKQQVVNENVYHIGATNKTMSICALLGWRLEAVGGIGN